MAFHDVKELVDRHMLVDAAHADRRRALDDRRDVLVAPQPRVCATEADDRGRVDAGDFLGIGAQRAARIGDAWLIVNTSGLGKVIPLMQTYRAALKEYGRTPMEFPITVECYVGACQTS